MITCAACGKQNSEGAAFCQFCGSPLRVQNATPSVQVPAVIGGPAPGYARPLKDRSIALILELLPGLFGIFGMGWIYSGNTTSGILWLVGMLAWGITAVVVTTLTAGIACFCFLPINLALLALSVISLNTYIRKHPDLFGV